MITELVLFDLPEGMTREQLIDGFRETSKGWSENPDLIRKNYLYDADARQGGGVYVWRDRAAAERWHGAEFRARVARKYGAEPVFRYFETPVVVDNEQRRIVDDAA